MSVDQAGGPPVAAPWAFWEMEDPAMTDNKWAQKCELCNMFFIIDVEDFMYTAKCGKIKELQEKLTDLHMKLCRMTKLNTALKRVNETARNF